MVHLIYLKTTTKLSLSFLIIVLEYLPLSRGILIFSISFAIYILQFHDGVDWPQLGAAGGSPGHWAPPRHEGKLS